MAIFLRATSAAAAAPNRITIGGAGTGAGGPPDVPVLPDELPLLLDEEEELLELLELLLPFEFQPPFELHPVPLEP